MTRDEYKDMSAQVAALKAQFSAAVVSSVRRFDLPHSDKVLILTEFLDLTEAEAEAFLTDMGE